MKRFYKSKFTKIIIFVLCINMLLTGCTNIVGGTFEVDSSGLNYSYIDDATGLSGTDLAGALPGGALSGSQRNGLNVVINYMSGDAGLNKYDSRYADAFYVAKDLSNSLEHVSFFQLLDTYVNASGNTTFVYAYTTKQYAGGALREDETATHKVDGDFVMYPDEYVAQNLEVDSNAEYTVLATYSYAQGASSYHEIARMKGNGTADYNMAKAIYATGDNGSIITKYYGIICANKLYIYDAVNLKAFSNSLTSEIYISAGQGVLRKNGTVDTRFSESSDNLVSGFVRCVDIKSQFDNFKSNDDTLSRMGSFNIEVYDFSMYSKGENYYIFLDITATKTSYNPNKEDIGVEAVLDADGNPIGHDYEEEISEAEARSEASGISGESYDFVGTICHVNIPEGTRFKVLYLPASTAVKYFDVSYVNKVNYRLVPAESVYDISKENTTGTLWGESDYFSNLFGYYSYVVDQDGSAPFGIDDIYSGVYCYDTSKNYGLTGIGNYELNDELRLNLNFNQRRINSSSYSYRNCRYKLVTNPDAYWSYYRNHGYSSSAYTINLSGSFSIAGSFDDFLSNTKSPSFLGPYGNLFRYRNAWYGSPRGVTQDFYIDLYNGKLDATSFVNANSVNECMAQFTYDDNVILYNTSTNNSVCTPYGIPATTISNIFTGFGQLSSGITHKMSMGQNGIFMNYRTVLIDGKPYMYFIYDKKMIICEMNTYITSGMLSSVTGIDRISKINEIIEKDGADMSSLSAYCASEGLDYYCIDLTKFAVDRRFSSDTMYSLSVAADYVNAGSQQMTDAVNGLVDNLNSVDVGSQINSNDLGGGSTTINIAGGTADDANYLVVYFNKEGISICDKADNYLCKDVSYEDATKAILAESTVSTVFGNSLIEANWNQSTLDGSAGIKAAIADGLHYRYNVNISQSDKGNGYFKIDIVAVNGLSYDTVFSYDILYSPDTFKNQSHSSNTCVIDTLTWNSICKYVDSKFSSQTNISRSDNFDSSSFQMYEANQVNLINGNFEGDGQCRYLVSTNPSNGLGFYNIANGSYYIPTIQRHNITNITVSYENSSGDKQYSSTDAKDEIVAIEDFACYGLYDNEFADSKTDYQYLVMGYEKQGSAYSTIEMLRAKMIPLGIAEYNSDTNSYYRDFKPVGSEQLVYYIPDAYFDEYGREITDKDVHPQVNPTPTVRPTGDWDIPTPNPYDGGATPTPGGVPSTTPGGGGGGNTSPTPGGGSGGNTSPTPGGGGGNATPTPGGGSGGNASPTPGGVPTTTPGGGSGGNTSPTPGGGGGNASPTPGGGSGGNTSPTPGGGSGGNTSPTPGGVPTTTPGGGGNTSPTPGAVPTTNPGGGGGSSGGNGGGSGSSGNNGGGSSGNNGGGSGSGIISNTPFTGEVIADNDTPGSLFDNGGNGSGGNGNGNGGNRGNGGDGGNAGNGGNGGSLSGNTISGNVIAVSPTPSSISANTVSDNGDGNGNGNGVNIGELLSWLLLLVLLLLMLWYIYKKYKEMKAQEAEDESQYMDLDNSDLDVPVGEEPDQEVRYEPVEGEVTGNEDLFEEVNDE